MCCGQVLYSYRYKEYYHLVPSIVVLLHCLTILSLDLILLSTSISEAFCFTSFAFLFCDVSKSPPFVGVFRD